MNVLHVTQNYYPSIGGTQHTMKKVSECLAEYYRDEVNVFTTNSYYGPHKKAFKKIFAESEVINNVHIKRFDFIRFHKPFIRSAGKISNRLLKKPLSSFWQELHNGPFSPSLLNAISVSEADVIGASSVHFRFADYPRWRMNTVHPKPFVLYGAIHISPQRPLNERYLQRIQQCEQYIANTTFEKEYLVNTGIEPEKIEVIGTATDILSFAPVIAPQHDLKTKYGIRSNEIVLTCISRHETSKGILLLTEAYSHLKKIYPQIRLVIAGGSGEHTSSLLKLASADKSILVLCDISHEEKAEILSLTDLLILPSKEESFGVVFLEAWSFCKPVIGAGIGAIASLIEEGKDGLLFNPDDVDSLVEKICILIDNKDTRELLGKAGYQKVKTLYQWDIITGKFRFVYEKAMEKFAQKKNGKGSVKI